MATLYVRDVPAELYDELKGWAADSGRSVNAEVLVLLEREATRRAGRDDWLDNLLAIRRELKLGHDDADLMIASIRAHRDAGL